MKKEIKAYAIRQISTGFFLPIRWDKARGYSNDEPTENCFPRLLKSLKSARLALRYWVMGVWVSDYEYDFDGSVSSIGSMLSKEHKTVRDVNDMEIVEFKLSESMIFMPTRQTDEKYGYS